MGFEFKRMPKCNHVYTQILLYVFLALIVLCAYYWEREPTATITPAVATTADTSSVVVTAADILPTTDTTATVPAGETITINIEGAPEPLAVLAIPRIVLPSYPETPRPDSMTEVFVQLNNPDIYKAYMFYYCPEMDSAYDFRKELGADNNFVRVVYERRCARVELPHHIPPGAKLMVRAIGYEPRDIELTPVLHHIDDSTNLVLRVDLKPKVYHCSVVLSTRDDGVLSIGVQNEEPVGKTFYGECKPLYSGDGNHADPICAFSCMACCYPRIEDWQVKKVLGAKPDLLKMLYRQLKDTDVLSFLVEEKEGDTQVSEGERECWADEGLDELYDMVRGNNWLIRSDESGSFLIQVNIRRG